MLKKSKNITLILIFLITCYLFWSSTVFSELISSIDYKALNKAGVKILIRDYEITDESTFEFELERDGVRMGDYIWSMLWGKDFGFYMQGVDPDDKEKFCPYVGEEEKQTGSEIEELDSGKHHITLVLAPNLIDAILVNGCAVSPKPRKAPDADKNDNQKSGSNVFPTIYN